MVVLGAAIFISAYAGIGTACKKYSKPVYDGAALDCLRTAIGSLVFGLVRASYV